MKNALPLFVAVLITGKSLIALALLTGCGDSPAGGVMAEGPGTGQIADDPGDGSNNTDTVIQGDDGDQTDPVGSIGLPDPDLACENRCEDVAIDVDDTRLGFSGQAAIDVTAALITGTLTYDDGTSTDFELVVAAAAETLTIEFGDSSEHCGDHAWMHLPVTVTLSTDDGVLDELFEGELTATAGDDGEPSQLTLQVAPIDMQDVGGSYTPDGDNDPDNFKSMQMNMSAWYGDARVFEDGDDAAESIDGYVDGSGELVDWECPETNGDSDGISAPCSEPFHHFRIGSLVFD